jgi:hypothetical protein
MVEVARGPHGRFQKYTHVRGISSFFKAIYTIFQELALRGRGQNFPFRPHPHHCL